MDTKTQKAYEIAEKLMAYLTENGWDSTLSYIHKVQSKNEADARLIMEQFENAVCSSGNGDFIFCYARDIQGANLAKLRHRLSNVLLDLAEFTPL